MAALLLMTVPTCFVACSSDNGEENTTLETPQFETVSALYDVTSTDSDIKSIELTASGNYIIVKNSSSYLAPKKTTNKKTRLVVRTVSKAKRAGGVENIIYGKFTKISNSEFMLKGYGKIVIEGSSDNALSITVTPDGGQTYTVPVAKHTQNFSSTLTSKICRTWSIASVRYAITFGGKKIFDKEYSMNDLSKLNADLKDLSKEDPIDVDEFYDDDEEIPTQVIFTKSGTFMVTYTDGTVEMSTWTWENEAEGLLHYKYYDNNDELESYVNVAFRDNQLALTESIVSDVSYPDIVSKSESEGDIVTESESEYAAITWYMNEVK